jgi:uncharacterized protein (DUF1697 family)
MITYVALVRGVNVGGNKMVAMADLRTALTEMGLSDVRTLLQSGNVVFRAPATASAKLEVTLENEIERRLGLAREFHVRTAKEWGAVVDANPFPDEAASDPGRLLVTFFKTALDPAKVKALQAAITGPELCRCDGRQLYMTFPNGMGTSKAPLLADRILGARGTGRNWNTVVKLAAMVGD